MDHIIGKKIIFKIPARNRKGKIVPNKFEITSGICAAIGPNPHLNIPLQILIGRTPYRLNHITDILHVYKDIPSDTQLFLDLLKFNYI